MQKTKDISKDWQEAGALMAQINLYGFWGEDAFLTKSGDLGSVLRVGGVDYESLDHAGRDYTTKRLEAALRSLDDKTRLYQIFFRHDRPHVESCEYSSPLVRVAVEQRIAHLDSRADELYLIEIYWVVMVDGAYAKSNFAHALSQLPRDPTSGLEQIRALFAGNKQRTMLSDQIERSRMLLAQRVQSLSGQLSDLTEIELLGAEEAFRVLRRLTNLCPSKIEQSKLHGVRQLDWQVCGSELEAHRSHLRIDDYFVRVLTLKELPGATRPLILRGLLDIPANFHVITEWHAVDNALARKEINKRRHHNHNSKTSFLSNLQDQKNAGPRDELVDDSKEARSRSSALR